MTHDEFDRRARDFFHDAPRPTAPASLHDLAATLPLRPSRGRRPSPARRTFRAAGTAAAACTIIVGALVLASSGGRGAAATAAATATPRAVPSASFISTADALSALRTFAGHPIGGVVTGPTRTGPANRYLYQVAGEGEPVTASVDAVTGEVVIYLDAAAMPATQERKLTSEAAKVAASGFLSARHISVEGMTASVVLRDHGEFATYEVTWQRFRGDVKLPDAILVGVNPATGSVFDYVASRAEVGTLPTPSIGRQRAIELAQTAANPLGGGTVERCELVAARSAAGGWTVVWSIQLSYPGSGGAAWVQVDAVSGTASIVGRG